MIEHDDDLDAALRALPRELPPPPHVAAALEAMNRREWGAAARRRVWQGAVAAALLVAAFGVGRATAPAPDATASRGSHFAFLLYGGDTADGDDRAAEYGAWARDIRRRGLFVTGERLADTSAIAGAPRSGTDLVRGFFIVEASDAAAALELARQHPHAQVGTIEVRAINTR